MWSNRLISHLSCFYTVLLCLFQPVGNNFKPGDLPREIPAALLIGTHVTGMLFCASIDQYRGGYT